MTRDESEELKATFKRGDSFELMSVMTRVATSSESSVQPPVVVNTSSDEEDDDHDEVPFCFITKEMRRNSRKLKRSFPRSAALLPHKKVKQQHKTNNARSAVLLPHNKVQKQREADDDDELLITRGLLRSMGMAGMFTLLQEALAQRQVQ